MADGSSPSSLLEIGFVARVHGLRGEVIVTLSSNREERVAPGAVMFGAGGTPRLEVVSAAAHPPAPRGAPHGGRWRVAFAGIADRSSAETLHGLALYGEPLEIPDELWVHALVGCAVVDTAGTACGRVESVEANPASDLLVLRGSFGGERLVPLVFVVRSEPGLVVIDPPEGLFDL